MLLKLLWVQRLGGQPILQIGTYHMATYYMSIDDVTAITLNDWSLEDTNPPVYAYAHVKDKFNIHWKGFS